MKGNILVIEDQKDIRDLMVAQLKFLGVEVDAVDNGTSGLLLLEQNNYHVLILDWMLPGDSGIEILGKIRSREKLKLLPVIMVTALTQAENIIQGLDAGADDYITKPFDMDVFHARVRAQLRRATLPKVQSDVMEFGELKIDKKQCKVWTAGLEVALTLTEFRIIETLSGSPGHVFTRAQLIEKIQGNNVFVTSRTMDTHVAGLRKKLGSYSDYIVTSRGIGYSLRAE
ncbi:MAG: response regulator transcription factor [Bacteriovoracaceae bacterium]